MDVFENERLFYFYTRTQIKVKEKIVVRKDMYVNENDRLFYFTLGHKLK
jgi:hypothetical protein